MVEVSMYYYMQVVNNLSRLHIDAMFFGGRGLR